MNNKIIDDLKNRISIESDSKPLIVRSPAVINLLGDYTESNDGFLLSAAVNKEVYIASVINGTNRIKLIRGNDTIEYDLNELNKTGDIWQENLIDLIEAFRDKGIKGFTAEFNDDIPFGIPHISAYSAGLAFTINELFSLEISKQDIAHLIENAEHKFASINLLSVDNKIIKFDCRTKELELINYDFSDATVVFCSHSGQSAKLPGNQLDKTIRLIRERHPEVKNLRDVSIDMLAEYEDILSEEDYLKCLYIVEENFRVNEAADCLKNKDITGFGNLMTLSHEGLKIDYQLNDPASDEMVSQALSIPGVYGSRMTEGGTINLVEKGSLKSFKHKMNVFFGKRRASNPDYCVFELVSGTSII
jgi:galactokinase